MPLVLTLFYFGKADSGMRRSFPELGWQNIHREFQFAEMEGKIAE